MNEIRPFEPDSMMWRINRERVVLLGGVAATVLQVAHPQVAFGVARHSNFREDGYGRLTRTLDAVYAVAFGSTEEVARVSARVGAVHARVRGNEGGGYSAFDPGAQLWVLATLIMASVRLFQRFIAPLEERDLDRFLADKARFGAVFGLAPETVPRRWSEFECYWESMLAGDLLGSDPACAEVAWAVLHPRKPWFVRPFSPALSMLAAEFIPPTIWKRLGLPEAHGPDFWPLLDALLPSVLRGGPERLRFAPQYLRARRRIGTSPFA